MTTGKTIALTRRTFIGKERVGQIERSGFGFHHNVSLLITLWEIDGETVETVSDFISWGSKITVNGDYSHEIKRQLLLRRKL